MSKKIIDFFKKHYYILTGFLIFLSFPTYDVWLLKGFTFFAWISLIPLFIYIREKNYKEVLFSSFIAGFIGNYLVYSWIGDFGANVEGGYYVILTFVIPSLTVFFITKVIISEYFSRKFERYRFFIYPSIWIFIDWLQSIGFLAFPWTYWGYSQFQFVPFIQLSSYTGIMGVTYILIMSNQILSGLFHKYLKKENPAQGFLKTPEFKRLLFFAAVMILITGYGQYVIIKSEANKKWDIRVAVIQSCISPWENWMRNRFIYLQDLEHYTGLSLRHEPDMIIWSESATLENISYHYANGNLNPFERRVLEIAKSSGKPIVTGEIGIIEDALGNRRYPQNNAVLIDGNGNAEKSYAKINLVPFGEWFPYGKWFPFIRDIIVKFGASDFVPGRDPLLFESLNRKFGVLICYEGIFYRLCRTYKNLGSEFLVNITNLGWTDAYAGHMQQFAASRFRAVENGVWFISASNTGFTALIDPYGRIDGTIPRLQKGYLISDIDFGQNHETFYAKNGDIFFYLAMVFVFYIIIMSLYKCITQRFVLNKNNMLCIIFIFLSLNICLESKSNADANIKHAVEQENNFNFEKNNFFLSVEKNLENNKYYAVRKLLDDFSAKYPNNKERKFYYYSAILNEYEGEYSKAIQNYQKAIDIQPEYSQARNNLGCLYLKAGRYIEAERQFLKAVEANPYSPFINFNLGDLYSKTEKFDIAGKYMEKACKYKPNYGEAYNKLGFILYSMKDYSKALKNFKKALEFNYASHETFYYIGLSHNMLGQTDLAISNLKKAVNIKKDFYKCIVKLGKLYHADKEYNNAIKYYLIAESINFDDKNNRILIAECYNEMKRYDDAIDVIERLIKQDLNNKKLLELLARVKENKFSEAVNK